MKRLLLLFILIASVAFAADVSGTWKGTAEGPNGAMERTFTFKVDGAKLTGETTSSFAGKSEIKDGTINGDDLAFTINVKFQDNEMTLHYKGKVTGDTMKLVVELPDGGNRIEWNVKRVS